MAVYEISTTEKKSVTEIEYWVKGDQRIKHISGFRWGSGWITTEPGETLDIDPENPNGVNVYDYDFELNSLDDGWYGDIEFPEDMDDAERERLTELWDEESYSGWEEDGWYNEETECWFEGALEIKLTEEDSSAEDKPAESTDKKQWPF